MAAHVMLEVKGIENRFGKQVVHEGLDLKVERGEILGIVGGSGSGKSVLLRTMTGLHQPNKGTAWVDGKNVNDLEVRERASTLGVLFQQGALFSGLSVLENIMAPLREFTDLPKHVCADIAAMKLQMVGLDSAVGSKKTSELSGGMIKRVALARAMAMDPEVLFLDEPTAGLDPLGAADFDQLVRELNETLGLTFVMITHDLDTLFSTCDRVAVLVDKKITAGTLAELMKSRHPWIHDYFHGPRSRAAQLSSGRQG